MTCSGLKVSIVVLCFSIFSCTTIPIAPQDYIYEKNAIQLHLNADPLLNLHNGMPHTLALCIYQLQDPGFLLQQADNTEGLYQLIECKNSNPGVKTSRRIIVHPDTEEKHYLDRAEGAKYVAIVAGYNSPLKEDVVRVVKVPVILKKKSLFKRVSKPGVLEIDMALGKKRILPIEKDQ